MILPRVPAHNKNSLGGLLLLISLIKSLEWWFYHLIKDMISGLLETPEFILVVSTVDKFLLIQKSTNGSKFFVME